MRIGHGDYDLDNDPARLDRDAVVSLWLLPVLIGIAGESRRMCRPNSTAPSAPTVRWSVSPVLSRKTLVTIFTRQHNCRLLQ
jgi:hypothetical protein